MSLVWGETCASLDQLMLILPRAQGLGATRTVAATEVPE